MKTLYLHIGSHKTGTTTIQYVLAKNKNTLNEHGISFISEKDDGNSSHLISYNLTDIHLDKGVSFEFTESIIQQFETSNEKAVLSAETFFWLSSQDEVTRLKSILSQYFDKIIVIAYLRRQDQLIVSHCQESIKDANRPAYFYYLPQANGLPFRDVTKMSYLDYDQKLAMWERVFDKQNMRVNTFDRKYLYGNDLIKDFLLNIDFNPVLCSDTSISKNDSLPKVNQVLLTIARNTLSSHHLIDRLAPNERIGDSKLDIGREQARDIYMKFTDGNERIKDRYRQFEARPTLFDESFTMYSDSNLRNSWTEEEVNDALYGLFHRIESLSLLDFIRIKTAERIRKLKQNRKS
jgi:hypothetical protein